MSVVTDLKNWKSALAGNGLMGTLGLLLTFVVNIRTMSTFERKILLDNVGEDFFTMRSDYNERNQKYCCLQKVY